MEVVNQEHVRSELIQLTGEASEYPRKTKVCRPHRGGITPIREEAETNPGSVYGTPPPWLGSISASKAKGLCGRDVHCWNIAIAFILWERMSSKNTSPLPPWGPIGACVQACSTSWRRFWF